MVKYVGKCWKVFSCEHLGNWQKKKHLGNPQNFTNPPSGIVSKWRWMVSRQLFVKTNTLWLRIDRSMMGHACERCLWQLWWLSWTNCTDTYAICWYSLIFSWTTLKRSHVLHTHTRTPATLIHDRFGHRTLTKLKIVKALLKQHQHKCCLMKIQKY